MLNLGNAITVKETKEEIIPFSNILMSEIEFKEAYQAFIDYKNVCEIVVKSKASNEAMEFANSLLNASVENIEVSAEALADKLKTAWTKLVSMWKTFYEWVKSLIPKLINWIKKIKTQLSKKETKSNEAFGRELDPDDPYNRISPDLKKVTFPRALDSHNGYKGVVLAQASITYDEYTKMWENISVRYNRFIMKHMSDLMKQNSIESLSELEEELERSGGSMRLRTDREVLDWLHAANDLMNNANAMIKSVANFPNDENQQNIAKYQIILKITPTLRLSVLRPIKDIYDKIMVILDNRVERLKRLKKA